MKLTVPFAQTDFPEATVRGRYSRGHPRGLIVHFTAGHPQQRLRDAIEWQVKKGFCYFVIDHEGNLAQNFKLSHWGYHAGDSKKYPSQWPSLGFGVSDQAVGVELCCPGRLDDRLCPDFSATPYDESLCRRVAEEDNRQAGWYYAYSQAQEETLVRLCHWLKGNSPDVFEFDHVLGHDEVSGPRGIGWRRKNDPGGSLSCTMSEFRRRLASQKISVCVGHRTESTETQQSAESSLPKLAKGLAKSEWLRANRGALRTMMMLANQAGGESPLTWLDVVSLLNAELGLDSAGRVDESHVHSLGEKGALPLPKAIRYWVPSATAHDAHRTLEENVYDFMRYLHGVKNKDVGRTFDTPAEPQGVPLYCGLFCLPGVADDTRAQARLLQATIHGWFLPENYRLRLPIYSIASAACGASSDTLANAIADLGFKHGVKLLHNRLANVDLAENLVNTAPHYAHPH